MQTTICPSCKHLVDVAASCSFCATSLPEERHRQPISPPKVLIIVLGFLILTVAAGVIAIRLQRARVAPVSEGAHTIAVTSQANQSPANLLENGRESFHVGLATEEFTVARGLLSQIPPAVKEFKEAQDLLKRIEIEERRIRIRLEITAREAFAKVTEATCLRDGMDVYISLSGPDKTTMKLQYVLMSRPLVYQLIVRGELTKKLKDVGFRKLVFSDGYYRLSLLDF